MGNPVGGSAPGDPDLGMTDKEARFRAMFPRELWPYFKCRFRGRRPPMRS